MDEQKKVLISHPTGNSNVRGVVDGFCKQGILESFHTSVACFKNSSLYRIGVGPLRDFRRRTYSEAAREKVHTHPWKEMGRMAASKLGIKKWLVHETGRFCIDRVYQDMDNRVARYVARYPERMDAVYAYEDCAERTFQTAKQLGMACLYDLPIGYWRAMRKMLEDERRRNPEWGMTLGGFDDSEGKLARKDRELAMADRIYVASSFTKKTLELYPGELAEVEVIPYGFPPVNVKRAYQPFGGRKVKVLFVGGLSQRKGLSYLFETMKGFEDRMELTVVGQGDVSRCPALKAALGRVRHIPSLSHEEVLALMATQDVLVFPSLFEGFGLVVTEAMSQGTPVVTTERTCGPDIITHGRDGWIVPAGSATPLAGLFETFVAHPEMLHEAGKEALKAASRRPWSCYEYELAQAVTVYLNER